MKLLGSTHGYGDEQHGFAFFFQVCYECRRGIAFDADLRIVKLMAASRVLDIGLAKEAAEAEVLLGLWDQGRRLSDKLRGRIEAVSLICIDS